MGPFLDRTSNNQEVTINSIQATYRFNYTVRLPRAVGTDLPEYHLCSDTNSSIIIGYFESGPCRIVSKYNSHGVLESSTINYDCSATAPGVE